MLSFPEGTPASEQESAQLPGQECFPVPMSHVVGKAITPLAAWPTAAMWLNNQSLVSDKTVLRLPKEKGVTAKLHAPQAIWPLILFSCPELSWLVLFLVGGCQLHEGRIWVLPCISRTFLCRLLCLAYIFDFFFFFLLELPLCDPQEETVSQLLLYRRSQICRSPGPMSPQSIDLAHPFGHEGRQQSSASQRPREATLLRAIACDFHMGRRGQEGRRPLALPAVLSPDKLYPWPSRAS